MEDFSTTGKMLRGSLSLLGSQLSYSRTPDINDSAVLLAAGLELLQAGLLVHDDIMDHDELRRGKPTFHMRLSNRVGAQSRETNSSERLRAAEAQGICVGDLFFFLAWKALSALPASVSSLVAHEHAMVTLAQMRDVEFGYTSASPSLDDVLEMYRLKTARYTIALPLTAGALLAFPRDARSQGEDTAYASLRTALDSYGEALGIVFQLQDDRLGLFGDEHALGKSVGSDLKEGKKTPYVLSLLPKLSSNERASLLSFFGKPSIQPENVEWLRSMVIAHGVDEEIRTLAESYSSKARSALQRISSLGQFDVSALDILGDFIMYSSTRSH